MDSAEPNCSSCKQSSNNSLKKYVGGKAQNVKDIKISQQELVDAIDKVKASKKRAPLAQSIK